MAVGTTSTMRQIHDVLQCTYVPRQVHLFTRGSDLHGRAAFPFNLTPYYFTTVTAGSRYCSRRDFCPLSSLNIVRFLLPAISLFSLHCVFDFSNIYMYVFIVHKIIKASRRIALGERLACKAVSTIYFTGSKNSYEVFSTRDWWLRFVSVEPNYNANDTPITVCKHLEIIQLYWQVSNTLSAYAGLVILIILIAVMSDLAPWTQHRSDLPKSSSFKPCYTPTRTCHWRILNFW